MVGGMGVLDDEEALLALEAAVVQVRAEEKAAVEALRVAARALKAKQALREALEAAIKSLAGKEVMDARRHAAAKEAAERGQATRQRLARRRATIEKVIRERGPTRVRDLLEAVRAAGEPGANRSHVEYTLWVTPTFRRVGDGTWGLAR